MLNYRFKNPYSIDNEEHEQEMQEALDIKGVSFDFYENDKEVLQVYALNNEKILAPKGIDTNINNNKYILIFILVKIWSKEFESLDFDNYFINKFVKSIINFEEAILAVIFFETIVGSLVKRRENAFKKTSNMAKDLGQLEISRKISEEIEVFNHNNNNIKDFTLNKQDKEHKDSFNEAIKIKDVDKSCKNINKLNEDNIINNNILNTRSTRNKQNLEQAIAEDTLTLTKRKRKAPTQLKSNNWKQTCYICSKYGDLICCDGCSNVAHQFCACLQVIKLSFIYFHFRLCQKIGSVKNV